MSRHIWNWRCEVCGWVGEECPTKQFAEGEGADHVAEHHPALTPAAITVSGHACVLNDDGPLWCSVHHSAEGQS